MEHTLWKQFLYGLLLTFAVQIEPSANEYFSPGQYGVGYQRYDAATDGASPLPTSLWYPTQQGAVGNPTLYRYRDWNYASPFVGVTDSHETPTDEQFPLVVMSAGYGGGGFQFAPLAEALASHGYVVAAPHHTTNDLSPRAHEQLTTMESVISRAADPDDWLYGLVDSNALALGGFSWGVPTTTYAIEATQREIGATLMLDGTVALIRDIPTLHVGGGAYSLGSVRDYYLGPSFFSLDVGTGTTKHRAGHTSFILNQCQLRDEVVRAGVAAGASRDEVEGMIGACNPLRLSPDLAQDRMNQHAVEFLDTSLKHVQPEVSFLAPGYATTEGDLWVSIRVDSPVSFFGMSGLLTDPTGRSLGIDATRDEFVDDFGKYSKGNGDRIVREIHLGIDHETLVAGEYVVQAMATQTTEEHHYSVYLGTEFDRGDDIVYSQRLIATGTVAPGESISPVRFQLKDVYADLSSVDPLLEAIRAGDYNASYDLNFDRQLNHRDILFWAEEIADTYIGDSNLDGEFNSSDWVHLFERGSYDDGIELNASWIDGDWNGDADFNSHDIVFAMTHGGYEAGRRNALSASVPEPTSAIGSCIILVEGIACLRRRRRSREKGST